MRVLSFLIVIACLVLPARAAPPTPAAPAAGVCGPPVTLNVTAVSSNIQLPWSNTNCDNVTLLNDGANEVFIVPGDAGVVATTAGIPLPSGFSIPIQTNATYIAAITATSTSTLRIMQATGSLKYGRGGGGSGFTPAVPSIAFTTLPGGAISSTVPGSGSFAVAAPSGLTSATWGGGCSGASTVTGFSVTGSTWSATFSTPSTPCTGPLTVTGTGSNTATALSPVVTIGTGHALLIASGSAFLINTGSKLLIQ